MGVTLRPMRSSVASPVAKGLSRDPIRATRRHLRCRIHVPSPRRSRLRLPPSGCRRPRSHRRGRRPPPGSLRSDGTPRRTGHQAAASEGPASSCLSLRISARCPALGAISIPRCTWGQISRRCRQILCSDKGTPSNLPDFDRTPLLPPQYYIMTLRGTLSHVFVCLRLQTKGGEP